MTDRTDDRYKAMLASQEAMFRRLGEKAAVSSIWETELSYYRFNNYAYTAPVGSFWPPR